MENSGEKKDVSQKMHMNEKKEKSFNGKKVLFFGDVERKNPSREPNLIYKSSYASKVMLLDPEALNLFSKRNPGKTWKLLTIERFAPLYVADVFC